MNDYDKLIASKIARPQQHGFEPTLDLNPAFFDWQRVIVNWAIQQGRCALFEDCGLGKTLQQLEWARQVCAKMNGSVLILCPLAVAEQTVAEGIKFGIKVTHVRQPEQVIGNGIFITNYERLELFKPIIHTFAGIVLDESSILKSFTGKTRKDLTDTFRETPLRLCCTATPSPNDFSELGQHADFLGICSPGEMLAEWFINDTANTGTWRLKGHASDDFWKWVSTWAACVSKPSDLGFDDAGFILPPLNMEMVTVKVNQTDERPDGELFRNVHLSATNIHKEMRMTCDARAKAAADLVATKPDESWVIWCNTNYEADALKDALKDAVEVRGSDKADVKEKRLAKFTSGETRVIITKPGIAGYGLNWQHCHNVIFVGLSYSFEDFYQALRRSYRFGQTKQVNCHVIQADTEGDIFQTIKRKIANHEVMRDAMRFSAATLLKEQRITIMNDTIKKETGENWELYHGDCVRVAATLTDNSIGFSVFSPPFADLFVYSADVQDMGNNPSVTAFMRQFRFLVDQLLRVTQPGRLCAVHCADLLSTKWKEGQIELKNFSGEIVDLFRDAGWLYHCRATIWKDPVIEMQRTKSLGLLHKQLLKDSAMSRVGMPEYVCVFRKPGINANPISHDREDYPVEQWQKDASPVWMDINQTRVLNGHIARADKDERHICPLQLDVIRRCLRLWSNPGDVVFSPFAGIASEGYCAVRMGRKFIGSELKESYFETGKSNLKRGNEESRTLFNM